MNETTVMRYGCKPTSGEKVTKRLLVWVRASDYDALLEECQAAGYQSLLQYIREHKLTRREAVRDETGRERA